MLKKLQQLSPLLALNPSQTCQIATKADPFNKVCPSAEEAVKGVKDGDLILFGGFGLCGIQENLIDALVNKNVKNLTCVGNNPGTIDFGIGKLLNNKQVKKMICTYIGWNTRFERMYLSGEVESELIPQGTLVEKCRAAGAGIPAFYTPTGLGTLVEQGGYPMKYKRGSTEVEKYTDKKERRQINGKDYIYEEALYADVAVIKAQVADTKGNLRFNKTARNFNPDFARAAKLTICEVEEIVEPGVLEPDDVHLPGIYVDKVIKSSNLQKRVENLVLDLGYTVVPSDPKKRKQKEIRERIAARAAKEMKPGMYVNLGGGMPTLIPKFLPSDVKIDLHTENGLLGIGPYPKPGQESPDLINAWKETVTTIPGSSFFSSSDSFGMIRGGHLDMTVLGSMQVSATGDISNWLIPGIKLKGMGGAMDLVSCGSKVMVTMQHFQGKEGKVLDKCTYPLTGVGVVSKLVTDYGVFDIKGGKFHLLELAKEYTLEDLKNKTPAKNLEIAPGLGSF